MLTLLRLASLCKIGKADTIKILSIFVILVVFDFYMFYPRMEIMGKMLFLSEAVTHIWACKCMRGHGWV